MIKFDEEKNLYISEGGRPLKRVSTVLEEVGISDMSMILALKNGEEILNKACAYGTAGHLTLEYLDKGQLGKFDPHFEPHIEAWEKFKKDFDVVFVEIEEPVVSESLGYGGRPDRIAIVRGRKAVIDLKFTCQFPRSAAIQTEAYKMAYNENVSRSEKIKDRYVIRPFHDGHYYLAPKNFFKTADQFVWRSALNICNWKGAA